MTAAPLVTVFSCGASSVSDRAFCKFAQFLGLGTELIPLQDEPAGPPGALEKGAQGGRILAFSETALGSIRGQAWFAKLLDESPFVFAYGFGPGEGGSPELDWLTGGAFGSVAWLPHGVERHFSVSDKAAHSHFPVAGKSFSLKSGSVAILSGGVSRAGVEIHISVNGHPHFVSVERGKTLVFALAGPELTDIDTVLAPKGEIRRWYPELTAQSIALRTAAGPWCWTSPVTPANFIVDDPYLRTRYGFFHFQALMRALDGEPGALTVAFIPHNYRRSDPETVDLVRRNNGRLSIAVHGCDHTGREYASVDGEWLAGLTWRARDRMEEHTRLNRLPYDNVMVFPQGYFSTEAVAALKACGFDAAVNSTLWPVDAGDNRLTIRDILQIAVTRYHGFPVFLRHYPADVFDLAFDALFQKPVLAVEHHGFFRHGYKPLVEALRELSAFRTPIAWMPLGRAIASSCLLRRTGAGQFEVRHVTGVLRLENSTEGDWQLALAKQTAGVSVKAVIANGRETPFEIVSNEVRYRVLLPAGRRLDVEIVHEAGRRVAWKPSLGYRLGSTLRRRLCEVRDNQLARSEGLLGIAERIKTVVSRR